MAACITYEPPGSLLKVICDKGVSAVSLQRVALPNVSKLVATAEFHYRLGEIFSEKEKRRGADGRQLCMVCDRNNLRTCHQKICDVAAHILRKHNPSDACGFCGACGNLPPFLRR
jgi:hypothetical protein